jgi:hypothetical protein
MDDLIDCKKQLHDTNSSTEHQILDQCKTKRTDFFLKCGERYTLNSRRLPTGDELQSFDVFGKHLTTSDLFQEIVSCSLLSHPLHIYSLIEPYY